MSKPNRPEFDTRFIPVSRFELRAETDDDGSTTLHGAAPPYLEWSEPIGNRFIEMFEPGAFADEPDIIVTHEHDDALLLGRTSSGTATVRDEDDARRYSVQLPETVDGERVKALQARGDLAGSSFEFRTRRGSDLWFRDAGEMSRWLIANRKMDEAAAKRIAGDSDLERRLIPAGSARMRQIGPVARPAYPQAGLAMRSLETWHESLEPDEDPTPRLNALRRLVLWLGFE
jgi:HK97 family phage prohead protease